MKTQFDQSAAPHRAPQLLALLCLLHRRRPQSCAARAIGPRNSTPAQSRRSSRPPRSRQQPASFLPHAKLERIATGFTWVEGPVWVNDSLFFADIPSNTIRRWTPGKGVSIFLQPSGYKGSAPYGGREPGSNGMTLDALGRLTVAGHAQRDIFRFESLNPEGAQSPSSPIATRACGSTAPTIWSIAPTARSTSPIRPTDCASRTIHDPEKDLQVNGVYRIPHALDQKPGAPPARGDLQLLISRPAAAQRHRLLARRKISLRRQLRAEEDLDALSRAARRHARRSQAAL